MLGLLLWLKPLLFVALIIIIHNGLTLGTLPFCLNVKQVASFSSLNKETIWFCSQGFPAALVVKNPPANAGDKKRRGFNPWLGRSPGIGNGNPLQYSCLESLMDRAAWRATDHRVAKSQHYWSDLACSTCECGYRKAEIKTSPPPILANPGKTNGLFTLLPHLLPFCVL